ncbi:MAG: carbon-nitrogen hydrolase family protein [Firmicutes bacterium]|nr:carbon-nitrogen hydrolase family protein [Bacillota bacterium]
MIKTEALLKAERACMEAKEVGADMVCLPEMFCCPYETKNFPKYAEADGGMVWKKCADLAREYGIYLVAGSVPELEMESDMGCMPMTRIYNTSYVFDREGRQIAKHRKMHLFDINVPGGQCFRESDTLTAGDEVTVFDTEFGKMGLCICYDVRFPELARLMALEGARMVLVPAAFNLTTGPAHWELVYRSEAMYNQMFYVATSPARDMEASYHAWGHSMVADPRGAVVAVMDEKEGYQVTELNLADVEPARQQIPLLAQRRTDVYQLKKL